MKSYAELILIKKGKNIEIKSSIDNKLIGRFSCLSCADVANITSYYNGKKYSYLMYKNGGGINIDKISETEGDYKNGLEVSIKVDIYSDFTVQKALKQVCFFDKLYVEYKGENRFIKSIVKTFNERTIVNCNSFSLCSYLDNFSTHGYFKVGKVIYPVSIDTGLNTQDIIINLPVGSVDITPNRENLQYTEFTKKTITKQLKKVKEELQDLVNKDLKKDYTLKDFYCHLYNSYYIPLNINDIFLKVKKDDVEIDESLITINNRPIPKQFIRILNNIIYTSIPKNLIYKTILKKRGDISLSSLLKKNINLAVKIDKTTKHITWKYFNTIIDKHTIILTYGALSELKKFLNEQLSSIGFSSQVKEFNIEECINFLFDNLDIIDFANDSVPENFIKEYKEEVSKQKRAVKLSNLNYIPIRKYHLNGYVNSKLNNIPNKGLVVYSKNTRDDVELKDVAILSTYLKGISCVITVKEEHLPLLANCRRFITLNNFLLIKNKSLSKLATSYIINKNLTSSEFKTLYNGYSVNYIPLIEEFKRKYNQELNCIRCYNGNPTIKDIIDYYINKDWINKYDIKYFKLSDKEKKALTTWNNFSNNDQAIINMLIFNIFGNLPNIGLHSIKNSQVSKIMKLINKKYKNECN